MDGEVCLAVFPHHIQSNSSDIQIQVDLTQTETKQLRRLAIDQSQAISELASFPFLCHAAIVHLQSGAFKFSLLCITLISLQSIVPYSTIHTFTVHTGLPLRDDKIPLHSCRKQYIQSCLQSPIKNPPIQTCYMASLLRNLFCQNYCCTSLKCQSDLQPACLRERSCSH